jgi:hypothetical protein
MEYTKKVLVIEYNVPTEIESAKDVPEFFNMDSVEVGSRAADAAKNFMDSASDDLCVGFIKGIEDGVILPADIIYYAFQHWARPFHMTPIEKMAALLDKIKE